jgi:hypothetical protein
MVPSDKDPLERMVAKARHLGHVGRPREFADIGGCLPPYATAAAALVTPTNGASAR